MSDGMLLLSWDSHHATFCDILSRLREKGSFTDVTLACEGKFYPLHKLVLSTCSEYLENIFEKTPCKHPVIVLNDIKCSELEALLSYMYAGEVSVPQSTLSLLIRAAELLQIKGLAVPDTPPSTSKKKIHACNPSHDEISPQAKRRRYEESNTSSQREQSQVLGGSLPSVTSLCGEKKQTSEHSKILTEGLEQEQVDQVIDHLQASEGSSFSQIEDVYIETDIKEEMVEDVDNTNTMRVSDPELDYQSHSSSCKMEDARVGPVTKDGCSFPVSEDYGKQPLDHQEILPPPTNVPDTSVSSTELQGWMTEGALGELSRLDGYSGAGIFESSSPIISQQGAPQQEQQMVNVSDQWTDVKGAWVPWENTSAVKKIFECPVCSQSFASSSPLLVHIRKHSKKPFMCPYCPKSFTYNSILKVHLRTHTGEKPFSCPHCNYRSTQSGALKTHMRIHSRESPYFCSHCSFNSTKFSDLKRHIAEHHV
ncbi:uncharacterized protein [Panulirus ornatus]|uniref:uncharacterized protein isoform X1 n=1 Tax=Panulirus ornatus TaxID=150431 RepID=UPI003A891584